MLKCVVKTLFISLNLINLVSLDSINVINGKKLYVRVDTKDKIDRDTQITDGYPGDAPLVIYVKQTGMLYSADNSKNVNICNKFQITSGIT